MVHNTKKKKKNIITVDLVVTVTTRQPSTS